MIWVVYWMNRETRDVFHGFVKANNKDDSFDKAQSRLMDGFIVTHVYKASENEITPQSRCLNFENLSSYDLF